MKKTPMPKICDEAMTTMMKRTLYPLQEVLKFFAYIKNEWMKNYTTAKNTTLQLQYNQQFLNVYTYILVSFINNVQSVCR